MNELETRTRRATTAKWAVLATVLALSSLAMMPGAAAGAGPPETHHCTETLLRYIASSFDLGDSECQPCYGRDPHEHHVEVIPGVFYLPGCNNTEPDPLVKPPLAMPQEPPTLPMPGDEEPQPETDG